MEEGRTHKIIYVFFTVIKYNLLVILNETCGNDEEGRESEPDILIEDHELHEG